MSKFLPDAAIASFDSDVKLAYQTGSKLRRTVRVKNNVVGSTHRFPKMGKGIATRRTSQAEVQLMNVSHTNATATLNDWNAPELTDLFDDLKNNFNELAELAETAAQAVGRRQDQLILDALDAASTTLTVPKTVGTTTALDTAKIRRTAFELNDQGVPESDRSFLLSARGLDQLLGDTEANSIDRNIIKTLFDGEIKHWVGFDFIMIETRSEGGLPVDGTPDRTNYGYHRTSIGLAIGKDMSSSVDWIALRTSWLSNVLFSAGSVGIDALGIVETTTTE